MRLYASLTSPYARKVRIVAAEKGLGEAVTLVAANPLMLDPPELVTHNPLGKIPVLQLDNGDSLYDSRVICEYLDGMASQPRLIPDGAARWQVLREQALADGIMDAAFNLVMERRRPPETQSAEWCARWSGAIGRGVSALTFDPSRFDLGQIAAASAIGYLHFRLGDLAWETPQARDWWAHIKQRESVASTTPPA